MARVDLLVVLALALGCVRPTNSGPAEPAAVEPDPPPPPPPPPPELDHEPASEPPTSSTEAETRPLSALAALEIYTPDPDLAVLQQTKAARIDKADGISIVGFCIETSGATSGIHTVRKFPGDPQIDAILRDTVATWRYTPLMVDGRPIKVCTQKTFKLTFR